MALGPHAVIFHRQEIDQVLLGHCRGIMVQFPVNIQKFFHKDIHLFLGQHLKPDDGCRKIPDLLRGKMSLRKPGPERLIAEYPSVFIFDALGCAAHQKADMSCLPLENIIVHGKNFLVIIGPCDGIGNFINIDQLINNHQHPLVSGAYQEYRKNFQKIVPGLVRHNKIDAQILFCLPAGGIFSPKPSQYVGFQGRVIRLIGFPVKHHRPGKFKSVYHAFQGTGHFVDLIFHLPVKCFPLGHSTGLNRCPDAGNPFFQNQRQGTAIRLGFCGKILNQFFVGGQPLPLCARKTPLRGQVGIHHRKAPGRGIIAYGLQEKTFSAAIFSHDKAKRSPALPDHLDIVKYGGNLLAASHRDIFQPGPGHYPALQGIDQNIRNSCRYLPGHISSTIPFTCTI